MRTLVLTSIALLSAAAVFGCSKTVSADRDQSVSPDGRTATQTQTRVRETPSGTQVKETATRTREVTKPDSTTMPVDATRRDPGAMP